MDNVPPPVRQALGDKYGLKPLRVGQSRRIEHGSMPAVRSSCGLAKRNQLHRFEGLAYSIVLTPPGTSQRTDKKLLLATLGLTEQQYQSRFCNPVSTGWRMTSTARKKTRDRGVN